MGTICEMFTSIVGVFWVKFDETFTNCSQFGGGRGGGEVVRGSAEVKILPKTATLYSNLIRVAFLADSLDTQCRI